MYLCRLTPLGTLKPCAIVFLQQKESYFTTQLLHMHAVIHLMRLLLNTHLSEVHLQSIGLSIFLINIDIYDKL